MTRSIYVIGGAGSGKSTFTDALITRLGCDYGPLSDLYSLRNRKALVTLRGHSLGPRGCYLGVHREPFPGSDGLDRASSPTGAAWLRAGSLPDFIISEGATLATRRFLTALHETTDLLLMHLHVEPWEAELRFLARGSDQKESFVRNTVTRSANLLRDMRSAGVPALSVDTGDSYQWNTAITTGLVHLLPTV